MMMRLTMAIALLGLMGLTTTSSRADDEPVKEKRYSPKGGAWSAVFPSEPKEISTNAGGVELKMYVLESAESAYMVGVAKLPLNAEMTDEEIQKRLEGARDGAVANVKGKLINDKKIKLGGKYPGIELRASIQAPAEGFVRQRIFIVGNLMYQSLVIGKEGVVDSKAATTFLDSLQLKK